jgi:D-amino-acid dehydrogenase
VAALSALQMTAGNEMAALLDDARAAHLLKMGGHLVLVEKPESVVAAHAEITRLAQFGIGANWLSPTAAKELAPDITAGIEGALSFTGTGHVADPFAVSIALLDAFVAAGGKFVQAEVTGIESTVSGFAASTSTGNRHDAAHVIVCCGAWSKKLATQLGYPLPLDTERGYHITLPGVFPRLTIPVASYERKVIMTPMSCGLRMTGTVEFGGLRLPPEPTRFTMLARHMNALAAHIPTENATTWMGFRPSLPDHLPVLGRVPDGRNIYFAFGHQHLGLTLAGVTARIITAQVRGDQTEISLAPFAPNRFY